MTQKFRARISVCPILPMGDDFWWRTQSPDQDPDDLSFLDDDQDLSVQKFNVVSYNGHRGEEDFSLLGHDSDYESHPEEELVLKERTETEQVMVEENESDPEEDMEHEVVMVEENESDLEEELDPNQEIKHEDIHQEEEELDGDEEIKHQVYEFDPEEEISLEETDGVSFNDYETDGEDELGSDQKTPKEINEEIKHYVVMADENESDPKEIIKQENKTKKIIDLEEEFYRVHSQHEIDIKVQVKHVGHDARKQMPYVKLWDERKKRSKKRSWVMFSQERDMHRSLSSRSRSTTSYRKNRRAKFSYGSRHSEYGSSFYTRQHHRQVKRYSTTSFAGLSEVAYSKSTQFYTYRSNEHICERISYPVSKRPHSTLKTFPRYFADNRANELKDCYEYEKYESRHQRTRNNINYERGETRGYHGKSNAHFADNHRVYRSRVDYGGGCGQRIFRHDLNIYQWLEPRGFSNYETFQTNFRARHDMAYNDRMFIQNNTNIFKYYSPRYRYRNA